jgi:hypothetical protein
MPFRCSLPKKAGTVGAKKSYTPAPKTIKKRFLAGSLASPAGDVRYRTDSRGVHSLYSASRLANTGQGATCRRFNS